MQQNKPHKGLPSAYIYCSDKARALTEHKPSWPRQLIALKKNIAWILDWWVRMVIQIIQKNIICCCLYHWKVVLKFSLKSAYNLFSVVVWFPIWQSAWWFGSPPKFNHYFSLCYPGPYMKFHLNLFITVWVMAWFKIGQSICWSRSPPKFNQLFLLPLPSPSIKF